MLGLAGACGRTVGRAMAVLVAAAAIVTGVLSRPGLLLLPPSMPGLRCWSVGRSMEAPRMVMPFRTG
jgi:hypothetical protein